MANTFDLESKLNRAIYALIVGTGVGTPVNTFAGDVSSQPRTIPSTTIRAGEGHEESSLGNFRFCGQIMFRDEGINQPQTGNPNAAFMQAQQRVSAIISELVQSDGSPEMEVSRQLITSYGRALAVDKTNGAEQAAAQSAAANADMVDFTMIYWRVVDYGTTRQSKELDSVFYEREIIFEALCCNSNVD